jgi:parallel beta-helix repeat protein
MKKLFPVFFLLLAAGPFQAATMTVSTVPQLISAVGSAANGDTILIADGTYALPNPASNVALNITTGITLKSINGKSAVTITANSSYIAIWINAANVTVDGVTISGAQFAVQVNGFNGAILRNLNVSTTGTGGQALNLVGSNNSVIELCTVTSTYNNGIYLSPPANSSVGSSYNLIINNTIQNTQAADGITLVLSDHNVISGNTISNTAFDGILLTGSQYNYIGNNSISMPHNGVTLTRNSPPSGRQSNSNYVGNNTVLGNPNNPSGGSDGLWFDYNSNYNMAFANDTSNSQENGLAIFNSVGNVIRGNLFHNNPQGGIFVFNSNGSSGTTPPAFNSLQQNNLYDHAANGGVTLDGAPNTDISFNYVANDPSKVTMNIPVAGILVRTGVTNTAIVSNLLRDVLQGEQIDASASGISLYLNRHLNTPNHYTFAGAGATWDSGSPALGGSYFSDFTTANGNPSNGSTPYTNIIQDNSGTKGMYVDRYPYQSESLGRLYSINSVLPAANSVLATGSFKTISWNSQGCVLVDLSLSGPTSQTIATGASDYGFYRWNVPTSITAGTNYSITMSCKDSVGTVRATTTSSTFTISGPDLHLLSPQANQMLDSGGNMMISWAKTANVVNPVSVYIRYSDSAAYALLQSNVMADYVTVPAPAVTSNQVSVMISDGTHSDSTDGTFTIRNGSSGTFTSPPASSTLYQGSGYPLSWVAPAGTQYVDIDLIGASSKNIATQLADFSSYLMPVPAIPGGAYLRLTFHNSSGAVITTANSPNFTIAAPPVVPLSISFSSGSPQSANLNSAFASNLIAIVRDAASNPVSGITVNFTAPGSGASGSFLGCGNPCAVTTNASGMATAPTFTANSTAGSYSVTATSPTASGSASFSLTNNAGSPPLVNIDVPAAGATVSGTLNISGWAIGNATAVATVQVSVDGTVNGTATYGLSRPDVCMVYPGRPGCPNVGFTYALNTASLSAGSHTITVAATDSSASPLTGSASVTVNVGAPPKVYIDGPAAGSTISGTVVVSGWAIDSSTPVANVQVKVDGVVNGTATYGSSRADVCSAFPSSKGCPNVGYTYSLDTTTLSAGSHTITVAATDSNSTPLTGTASVTVTVLTPPKVYIDGPAAGSTISGTVVVSGWAIDSSTPVTNVQVKVDGVVNGTATYGSSRADVCSAFPSSKGCPNVGFVYSLNTSSLSAGSHTITVAATDGNATPLTGTYSVTVNVLAPPKVYIDGPAAGSTVSGTVVVSGWAIDSATPVTNVQVKVDGVLSGTATYGSNRADVCSAFPSSKGCPNVGYVYSLDTTTLSAGSHTITVVATDGNSTPLTGTASVTVTVLAPPKVYIDGPSAGATISGTVVVSGWAVDSSTPITNVQVKVDGVVNGTATYGASRPDVCSAFPSSKSCPNVGYSYSLNTSSLAAGSHTITVAATDSNATPLTGTYSVTVTVTGGPRVYIDSPSAGSTISGTVVVSGWAIDSSTPIASVQVKVDGVVNGTATYGASRPDVCSAFPSSKSCPNVGYSYSLNTASLSSGSHTITVAATDSNATPLTGTASVTVTK